MTDQTGPAYPVAGLVFVAVMLVAGPALAFLFKVHPGLIEAVPGLVWLLGIALLYDLGVNVLAIQGRLDGPLPMPWRFGGFFAGAILHIVTNMILA